MLLRSFTFNAITDIITLQFKILLFVFHLFYLFFIFSSLNITSRNVPCVCIYSMCFVCNGSSIAHCFDVSRLITPSLHSFSNCAVTDKATQNILIYITFYFTYYSSGYVSKWGITDSRNRNIFTILDTICHLGFPKELF